jgi:hypothetical protein
MIFCTKRSHLARSGLARRCHARAVGVGLAAGVFTVSAPTAHADILDLLIDPLADAGSSAAFPFAEAGNASDALAAAVPALSDQFGRGAEPADAVNAVTQGVEAISQAWINNPIGEAVDGLINAPFAVLFGRDLIGNGVEVNAESLLNTSLLGKSGSFGNFTDGGFLIGNGGNGAGGVAEFEGGVGYPGGSAGLFGDGGGGGMGAPGDAGGAGGNGGLLIGNGGAGGAGGASDAVGVAGGAGGAGGHAVLIGNGGDGGAGGAGYDGSAGGPGGLAGHGGLIGHAGAPGSNGNGASAAVGGSLGGLAGAWGMHLPPGRSD